MSVFGTFIHEVEFVHVQFYKKNDRVHNTVHFFSNKRFHQNIQFKF